MTTAHKLTPHDERRVAVAAGCDPRTVRSVIAGKPAHSTTVHRVHKALHDLNLVEIVTVPISAKREGPAK